MLKTTRPPLPDALVHGEDNVLLDIDPQPVHVSSCTHLRRSGGAQM